MSSESEEGQATQRVTIRRATRDDLPAVLACLAAAFEPYRARYTPEAFQDTVLTRPRAEKRLDEMTILVAERDGLILGTIAYRVIGDGTGHLRGMAVLPDFHGQGLADKLLQAAESALRAAGCSCVTLNTTHPLERAVRFYAKQGYEPTGAKKDYFGMPLIERAKRLA